jgi:hypothetical protein
MQIGDRVKCKYPPFSEGIIVRIGDYLDNPYTVMVQSDDKEAHNYKPEHLEVFHGPTN